MLKKKTVKKTCKSSVRKKSGGWGWKKVKMTKKIGGKEYKSVVAGIDKEKLKATAKSMRKSGDKVRLLKGRNANKSKNYSGGVFELWYRK